MVVNFPCTDWLNYLRTQLKVFVGGVCLQSRRFFLSAVFSNKFLCLKQALYRVIAQREFVQLPSNLDSS